MADLETILCNVVYHNIEEFIEQNTHSPTYEKECMVFARNKEKEEQMIHQYEICYYLPRERIKKMLAFDFTYMSEVESLVQTYEERKESFSNDSLLSYAMKKAKGDMKAVLQDAENRIYRVMETRIRLAKEQDEAKIAAIKNGYIEHLQNIEIELKALYEDACQRRKRDYVFICDEIEQADTEEEYKDILKRLELLHSYRDSQKKRMDLIQKLDGMIEVRKKEEKYQNACAQIAQSKKFGRFAEAGKAFEALGDYKDSREKAEYCKGKMETNSQIKGIIVGLVIIFVIDVALIMK